MPVEPDRGFRAPRERQFVRTNGRLRKVFAPDEGQDRDREAEAIRAAAGLGVPVLFELGADQGRPWFEIAWTGDKDLRMHVGEVGPLPSREVARIGLAAARIFERIHGAGLVHGDIKPANLVLDEAGEPSLVDWEHALAREAEGQSPRAHNSRDGRDSQELELETYFTGGTHGYAPPEAYLGQARAIAFDLYGLGATLHFALTGFAPPRHASGSFDARLLLRLRPTLPRALLGAIVSLLDAEVTARPTADRLVAIFSNVEPSDDGLEHALLAGEDFPDATEHRGLIEQRIAWRKRLELLLQAIGGTADDLPAPERVRGALRFCRAIWLCSNFVPKHAAARERIGRARLRLPPLLNALPGEVQRLRQQLDHGQARQLAYLGLDLCRVVSLLVLPDRDAPRLVDASGFALQAALRTVEAAERRARTLVDRIETAEARLDFDAASSALSELFENFSGANRNTAKLRDRHQRFVWLLERFVAGSEGVRDAIASVPRAEKRWTALRDFLGRAHEALGTEIKDPHRSLNLCARLLNEVGQGWPKLDTRAAIEELTLLRRELSERAALLVASMAERMQKDPVPLRPLLRELVEVDHILLLDCLIDTTASPRSALLDRLDKLRLRVEELSDQHRRLARGAREQLEQGRLTTALYDLERALEASVEDESLGAEESIRLELEKVRKLRDDVRDATRRNLELAEAFERLATDREPPDKARDKSLDLRMNILAQREQVLTFLLENGARPFRVRYQRELQELRILRLQVQADDAERRYREATRAGDRLEVGVSMQEAINTEIDGARLVGEEDSSGRLDLLRARWNDYVARAERDVVDQARAHERRRVERLLRLVAMLAFFGVSIALVTYFVGRSNPVDASDIAAARSIRDFEELRDRSEDPSVREALLALVEALRTSGDERKRRVQSYAASVERVVDPALRAALEVRLAGLER